MEVIRKMLTNYLSILQNLREEHSLLIVMHVFFVGGAVLTLLLVLLAGVFRLFWSLWFGFCLDFKSLILFRFMQAVLFQLLNYFAIGEYFKTYCWWLDNVSCLFPEDRDAEDHVVQNIKLFPPKPSHSSAVTVPLLSLSLELLGHSGVSDKISNIVPVSYTHLTLPTIA